MAVDTLIAEEGWAGRPATKGDLLVVQTHLEGKIKDVGGKIKDVGGMIKDVRIEVGNGDICLRMEIAKLRVSIVVDDRWGHHGAGRADYRLRVPFVIASPALPI